MIVHITNLGKLLLVLLKKSISPPHPHTPALAGFSTIWWLYFDDRKNSTAGLKKKTCNDATHAFP